MTLRLSLTPGFSRVSAGLGVAAASAASSASHGKPLKRFSTINATHTRLKPGANERRAHYGLNHDATFP